VLGCSALVTTNTTAACSDRHTHHWLQCWRAPQNQGPHLQRLQRLRGQPQLPAAGLGGCLCLLSRLRCLCLLSRQRHLQRLGSLALCSCLCSSNSNSSSSSLLVLHLRLHLLKLHNRSFRWALLLSSCRLPSCLLPRILRPSASRSFCCCTAAAPSRSALGSGRGEQQLFEPPASGGQRGSSGPLLRGGAVVALQLGPRGAGAVGGPQRSAQCRLLLPPIGPARGAALGARQGRLACKGRRGSAPSAALLGHAPWSPLAQSQGQAWCCGLPSKHTAVQRARSTLTAGHPPPVPPPLPPSLSGGFHSTKRLGPCGLPSCCTSVTSSTPAARREGPFCQPGSTRLDCIASAMLPELIGGISSIGTSRRRPQACTKGCTAGCKPAATPC
jgi:hypothetical protein